MGTPFQEHNASLSKEKILESYILMHQIRTLEAEAAGLYSIRKIVGFLHLYDGQEAIVGAFRQVFQAGRDTMVTTYRCHGHALALGFSPHAIFAELMGKQTGSVGGKGGSMHFYNAEKGLFGGQGIVGTTFPIGTGLALAHKRKADGGVAFSFIGDGGMDQGQVYESLNMSALWDLPIVFVLEDNHYSMGTAVKRHTSNPDFTSRGVPWKIKTLKASGQSLFESYKALSEAAEIARNQQNPVLVVLDTYRYQGHSMSDPGLYRSKEEVKKMRTEADPLKEVRNWLLEKNVMDEDGFKDLETKNKNLMKEAKNQAEEDPFPSAEDLYTHVTLKDIEPSNIGSGGVTATMTVREALRSALEEEMTRDSSVFLMGEEVALYQGAYKISKGLLDRFGAERIMDTPITEMGFTGVGVGAAFGGLRPIVEYMNMAFALQGIDHIFNSAFKTLYMSNGSVRCPIVFRGLNGLAPGTGAQHSQCFANIYANVPGGVVLAPYSATDAKGLLKAAIRSDNPVVFLENETLYGQSFDNVPIDADFVLPIGAAHIEREGRDVTLVAYSIAVGTALAAAEQLAREGIEAEVINLRSLRPLDMETLIRSLQKTHRAVTIEESWGFASIGGEIAATLSEKAFDELDAPIMRLNLENVPVPYSPAFVEALIPTPQKVVAAAKTVCYHKGD